MPAGELRRIPLAELHESPLNPREHYDAAALAELVASLLQTGQLTPIIVRPRKAGGYEIAAGHRRYRAAVQAGKQQPEGAAFRGLTALEAKVVDLDERAFVEVLNIENLQRDDLHPLEEARGFRDLMEKAGYDVAKIAARIGRSTRYVYDSLTLLKLRPEARKLFLEGKFERGHAVLLARLTPADQKKVIGDPRRINRYHPREGTGLFQPEYAEDDPDQPGLELKQPVKARSVRELATYINDHIRFRPEQNDLPTLFPTAAAALEAAEDEDLAPVYITYDHILKHDAKDHKVRTYGVVSWRRADGKQKSKTCVWSRWGIVAAGRDRGEAFRVCVNRDKCEVHFKASAKRRKRAPAGGGGSPINDTGIRENLRRQAEDKRRQAAQARWKKATPALLTALAAAISSVPTGAASAAGKRLLDSDAVPFGHKRYAKKHVGVGRTAEDLVRYVTFVNLACQLDDAYGIEQEIAELKDFGVDAKAILDKVAPESKVEKVVVKTPLKKKGARK